MSSSTSRSARGDIPASTSTEDTSSTRSGSESCLADRLTLRASWWSAESSSFQARTWAHAVRRTHDPSGTMRPVCSAMSKKALGARRPLVGCCHRTSASTPTRRLVHRSMMGW